MYEFKGLVASVATSSKANNENAGFLTPRNKHIVSRKAIFSENAKVALGDLKNIAFNVITPMKNANVFIEKTKTETAVQLSTPIIKHNKPPITSKIFDHLCVSHKSVEEMWADNLMLDKDQFNLLFMEPNYDNAPPTPTPESPPEFQDFDIALPSPSSCWTNFGYESTDDTSEVDLPPVNKEFFADYFGINPLKENEGKIANRDF